MASVNHLAEMQAMLASTMSAASAGQSQTGEAVPSQAEPPAPVPQEQPVAAAPSEVVAEPVIPTETEQAQEKTEEDDFVLDLDENPEVKPEEIAAEASGDPAAAQPGETESTDPDRDIGALLATTRGKRIYAAFKAQQQLAKAPEEGGIGHAPTPSDVSNYWGAYVAEQKMLHDFSNGATTWAEHWFASQRPGAVEMAKALPEVLLQKNPEAFRAFVQTFPQVLQQASPEAFREVARPVSYEIAKTILQAKSQATTPEQAQQIEYAARLAVWAATGEDPGESSPNAQQQGTPQVSDEVQRLRAELERERQKNQETQSRSADGARKAFAADVARATAGALESDVDKALERAKDAVKDPLIFGAIRQDFVNKMREYVARNATGRELLNIKLQQAMQSGNREAVPGIVKEYRKLYANALLQKRPEYLKAAGVHLQAQSAQQATQLRQAASKVSPDSGVRVPTEKPAGTATGPIQRLPNETQQEFMKRMLMADMTSSLRPT